MIKDEVTISDNTSSDDENHINVLAFTTTSSFIDPPTAALEVQEAIVDDYEDNQDEFLNSYHTLLLENIKSEKDKRKAREHLDKKEQEIRVLKKTLEEIIS